MLELRSSAPLPWIMTRAGHILAALGCGALLFTVETGVAPARAAPPERPNIILLFADDISARELPIYGSSVWSPPKGGNTSDPRYRAKTPVLDQLAREGCWITTAWAATVCSPSRAMMMTGRYAHLHKWWDNKDKGVYRAPNGKLSTWPLYESSPLQLGHIAQKAGYGTFCGTASANGGTSLPRPKTSSASRKSRIGRA